MGGDKLNTQMPIPNPAEAPDGSRVKILESFEPLVAVDPTKRIRLAPAYYAMGFASAENSISLRSEALSALHIAANSLPDDMTLLIWDGVRSLSTQKEIADRFVEALRDQLVGEVELNKIVAQYVSPLPTSVSEFLAGPPPHTTGGAVDLTLADARGRPLDLGAKFDQFDETAWLTHYEAGASTRSLSRRARQCCALRRILYWTMTEAGFAPYPWEFWHFEYGTRRAAAFRGADVAKYGPAVPFQLNGDDHDLKIR